MDGRRLKSLEILHQEPNPTCLAIFYLPDVSFIWLDFQASYFFYLHRSVYCISYGNTKLLNVEQHYVSYLVEINYLVTMTTTVWSSCIGYIIMSALSRHVFYDHTDQDAPYWISIGLLTDCMQLTCIHVTHAQSAKRGKLLPQRRNSRSINTTGST